MTPGNIGTWLTRRWPVVGGALLFAAVAVTLALNLQGSGGIFAQAEPTPGAITDDSQFPTAGPFNPQDVPTMVIPDCYEEFVARQRRDRIPLMLSVGSGPDSCVFVDKTGRYYTESMVLELIAEVRVKEALERHQRAQVDEEAEMRAWLASIRSITFYDGTTVKLPSDVSVDRVANVDITCVPGEYCPQSPLYRLVRGKSVVWVDFHGYMTTWDDDRPEDVDPDAFPFLTNRDPGL